MKIKVESRSFQPAQQLLVTVQVMKATMLADSFDFLSLSSPILSLGYSEAFLDINIKGKPGKVK